MFPPTVSFVFPVQGVGGKVDDKVHPRARIAPFPTTTLCPTCTEPIVNASRQAPGKTVRLPQTFKVIPLGTYRFPVITRFPTGSVPVAD